MEAIAETVFGELFQAKAIIVTFSIFGVTALICAFWNPSQFFVAVMCAIMVICGICEYKKAKKK